MSGLRIIRYLRDLLDVATGGGSPGDVLTLQGDSETWSPEPPDVAAPTDATYLTKTAHAGLSAEEVVGNAPGGELGGTWAAPTVDAVHSGSSHAQAQAAAEATASAALAAHSADETGVHGIADTDDLILEGDARLTDARTPTGAAGGVLGGTYPNPSFAADMATQAELNAEAAARAAADTAHQTDTSDAHPADAIGVTPFGSIASTNVQDALEEIIAEASPGVTDHGALSGLADDDHPQYTLTAEAQAMADAAASTAAGALAAHAADETAIHGIADTDDLIVEGDLRLDDSRAPNGPAGGVLSGTYPDPGFAADMATQAELDAHVNDATDAHDASAISFTPNGSIDSTDVQAAIQEVRDEAAGGGAPSTADYLVGTAHAGLSAEIVVGASPGGELGGTWSAPTVDATHSGSSHAGVQSAAEATAQAALDGHTGDATDAHDASAISFAATGGLAADDVQEALAELDSEKTTAAAALAAAQTEIADQRRAMVVLVTAQDGTAITTGDGKAYVGIPNLINGHNLVSANAQLVGQSSSGNVTVQVHNVTQAADMLSTAITIQANESHSKDGTPGVVDAANDDVAYGDLIRIDIDAAGTGADGLIVVLEFEAP